MKSDRYPHKCKKCGAPAYEGLNEVDCSANCGDSNSAIRKFEREYLTPGKGLTWGQIAYLVGI